MQVRVSHRNEQTCRTCGDVAIDGKCVHCGKFLADGRIIGGTNLVPTLSYLRPGEYVIGGSNANLQPQQPPPDALSTPHHAEWADDADGSVVGSNRADLRVFASVSGAVR
jgi:hypothetical protein